MNLCLLHDYIVGIGVEYMNILCACHVQHFTDQYAKYYLLLFIHFEWILYEFEDKFILRGMCCFGGTGLSTRSLSSYGMGYHRTLIYTDDD